MESPIGFLIIIYTAFSFHVIMFGIEVILSLIIVMQLIYEYFSGKSFFRSESHKFMNYIAVTYASAHFFLTATTVMALSFFPEFLVFAGQFLFYPLGFIIGILILRLLMISYFWYGWGKFSKKIHLISGSIFAISGVIWVYLYTVLLAAMNYSTNSLLQVEPDLVVDHIFLFVNPTLLPLLLTIVFGAMAATCSFLVFYYGRQILNRQKIELPKSEYEYRLFQYHNYIGFTSLILFLLSYLGYLYSLKKYSTYKFNNIIGGLVEEITPYINLTWMFILQMVVIFALIIFWASIVKRVYSSVYHEELITQQNKWQFLGIGPVMAIIFELFVLLNFISQAPYFFISTFNETTVGMQVRGSINQYANIIDMYSLTIFGFLPLLIAFASLLYFFFTGTLRVEEDYNDKQNPT